MTKKPTAVPLDVAPRVRAALDAGRPVAALESTIITHGMPRPTNLETARRVEATVREHGAEPATIAILDGRLRVGLEDDELEALAACDDAVKVSRRDLAVVLARRQTGATTVAATMWIAAQAGIRVFVTGGIGGVHRGASETFDVSADLTEIGRTPVVVVCAGAKSILDLGATLEVLETQGVPVLGYQTERFPAFFTRDSGLPLDTRVESVDELARIVALHFDLDLGGAVAANPIPEADSLDPVFIEEIVARAVGEAEQRGVRGKEATPFLLERIEETTGGASLRANIALILSNARLGAALAKRLSES